jgi:transketolase
MDHSITNKCADNIRILSAAMVEKAKSGHPGGAMGGADFINILYSEFLKFDPTDLNWPMRDRFFLDPGHMSPMIYSVLSLFGIYQMDEIREFRQWGSSTPGHPEKDLSHGIENTSGPLGQGHAMAVGAAIAERFLSARFGEWMSHKTYSYVSDGGIQEEISQGAGRIAGFLGLSNLIMFYDSNEIQLSTRTELVTSEDTAAKYKAWGWRVETIDGNNQEEIRAALGRAVSEKEKPYLIIGRTIMGKGALTETSESFEGQTSTHGMPLSQAGASYEKTIKNLGGDPQDPFVLFPQVREYYTMVSKQKAKQAHVEKLGQLEWEKKNPEQARKLRSSLFGQTSRYDFSHVPIKPNVATRAASGALLSHFSGTIENMIVASADLANSDKTDGFLKNTKPFARGDFSGAFLHVGVSELTMAAIMNGMALHGGVIPVGGTFFVFSDFMKPAVRLAALMELPVKYIWTHDAFRVGEDGPTHQPVEQEAQIRLLEQLRNHSGRMSMLVLRPADAAETHVAWEMALENKHTPTALLLSRQSVRDLPARKGSTRISDASGARKGAYLVRETGGKPDIILLGNGSEVSTLYEASLLLEKEHKVRTWVISVISEGLFREQEESYQNQILPGDVPVFGLTAGLPSTLSGLLGKQGRCHGLEHFGYSAPAGVLDQKFGFTPEHVVTLVLEQLKK